MRLIERYKNTFNGNPHPEAESAFSNASGLLLRDEGATIISQSICSGMVATIYRSRKGFIVTSITKDRSTLYHYTDRQWALAQYRTCASTHILIHEKEYQHGNH